MPSFGRPLSGAIAAVGIAQTVSTVSLVTVPQWEESFAVVSNLAYVFSGCYHSLYTKPRLGSLSNPAFPLLFLGGSSFAFHADPLLFEPKHTLDLFAGWVVVLHLACASVGAAAVEFASEVKAARPYAYLANFGFLILFSSGLVVIALLYAEVYHSQILFYATCAGSATVFALLIRARLSESKHFSVAIAVFETVVIVCVAVSAIFLQGELVGKRLSNSTDKQMYSLFHGMWHVQLAFVVSLLNVRFADIMQQARSVEDQAYIVDINLLDTLGALVFFGQSIALLVLKETESSVVSVQLVLGVGSALHVLHTLRFVYINARPDRVVRASEVRPFIGL